jgi:tRNA (mo5U34)-methyltransferase
MSSLEQDFAKEKWFHSIDFGAFASAGRFPEDSAQNITLFGFMDLVQHVDPTGADVLDIGAVDGISSFGLKKRGAARVVATDTVEKSTFLRARDHLGLDIEYRPGIQIKDFEPIFAPGSFDLIVCAGVIYHMFNPFTAFQACRKMIREDGLLFMETPYVPNDDRGCIYLNSEAEISREVFTYSIPTEKAVTGMMKLAGFDVLAVRKIHRPDRITVLGRASALKDIGNRTETLKRIHERDTCDHDFRYADHLPTPGRSTLKYTGPRDNIMIDHATYQPNFPFHPPRSKRTVGETIWLSKKGNHL